MSDRIADIWGERTPHSQGTVWPARMVVNRGAQGLRDRELLAIAQDSMSETRRQLTWLETRMKAEAPQALIDAP